MRITALAIAAAVLGASLPAPAAATGLMPGSIPESYCAGLWKVTDFYDPARQDSATSPLELRGGKAPGDCFDLSKFIEKDKSTVLENHDHVLVVQKEGQTRTIVCMEQSRFQARAKVCAAKQANPDTGLGPLPAVQDAWRCQKEGEKEATLCVETDNKFDREHPLNPESAEDRKAHRAAVGAAVLQLLEKGVVPVSTNWGDVQKLAGSSGVQLQDVRPILCKDSVPAFLRPELFARTLEGELGSTEEAEAKADILAVMRGVYTKDATLPAIKKVTMTSSDNGAFKFAFPAEDLKLPEDNTLEDLNTLMVEHPEHPMQTIFFEKLFSATGLYVHHVESAEVTFEASLSKEGSMMLAAPKWKVTGYVHQWADDQVAGEKALADVIANQCPKAANWHKGQKARALSDIGRRTFKAEKGEQSKDNLVWTVTFTDGEQPPVVPGEEDNSDSPIHTDPVIPDKKKDDDKDKEPVVDEQEKKDREEKERKQKEEEERKRKEEESKGGFGFGSFLLLALVLGGGGYFGYSYMQKKKQEQEQYHAMGEQGHQA